MIENFIFPLNLATPVKRYQRKKYSGFRKCHAEHLYIIQKIRAYPFQQLCQLFADAAIIIKLECRRKQPAPEAVFLRSDQRAVSEKHCCW
ncbi:MAG: hypothetical protein V8R78_11720 [Evtepia gabavorous]